MFASKRFRPSFNVDGLLCADQEHLCHCLEHYGDTHKSIGRLVHLLLLTPDAIPVSHLHEEPSGMAEV